MPVTQKHRMISCQENITFSTLHRVVLGLPSPSRSVCTGRRVYADVTTKISQIDRLPNLLSNGAPLARSGAGSSIMLSFVFHEIQIYCPHP